MHRLIVQNLTYMFALTVTVLALPTVAFALSAPITIPVNGVIVDSLTERGIVGATVYLAEAKLGVRSSSGGSFGFESVTPGVYTMVVRAAGYALVRRKITVGPGQQIVLKMRSLEFTSPQVDVQAARETSAGMATQPTQVIEGAELDKHRGQTIGESLAGVPGVTLLQTGPSISKPVIRGLHSQRIVVINAGVQQEGQQWGAEHAPEIDPFTAARIEVLKGPASLLYGAGAIGGVVRFEPRLAVFGQDLGGELIANGFSNNRQGAVSLMLEQGIGSNLAYRVQGSTRRAGDASSPNYVLGNTGFHERDGSAMLAWRNSEVNLQAYYSHFSTELGIFRGAHIGNSSDLLRAIENGRPFADYTFGYQIRNPKQEVQHDLFVLSADMAIGGLGRLDLRAGIQQNQRQEFDAVNIRWTDTTRPAPLDRPAMSLLLSTYTVDAALKHTSIGGLNGSVGFSVMRQFNDRSGSTFLIPDFLAYSVGVYVVENLLVGDWLISGGIRYDHRWLSVFAMPRRSIVAQDLTFGSVSASIGLQRAFSEEFSFSTNLGTAWRPPAVNELFSNDVHHGTATYEIGDARLGEERSATWDLTFSYQGESVRLELTPYLTAIDNFIYSLPDTVPTITIRGSFPTFRFAQTAVMMRGFEVGAEYDLSTRLRVQSVVSLVRADDVSKNVPLIFMPSDQVRTTLHYDVGEFGDLHETYLELLWHLVRRQDRFPLGIDYVDPPAGYGLLSLTAGGEFHFGGTALSITVTAHNILNQSYRNYLSRYRYFAEDPGRNLILRVNLPFGGPAKHFLEE